MSRRIFNRRQAPWSMFLSDFVFVLDFLPGVLNTADAPSRRSNFELKEGDDTWMDQLQYILTDRHCRLIHPTEHAERISTFSPAEFSLETPGLLAELQEAYKTDTEWRSSAPTVNSTFLLVDNTVYHTNKLFIPTP